MARSIMERSIYIDPYAAAEAARVQTLEEAKRLYGGSPEYITSADEYNAYLVYPNGTIMYLEADLSGTHWPGRTIHPTEGNV